MASIGLDIGTTTISVALVNEDGSERQTHSEAHCAALPERSTFERIQDPDRLFKLAVCLLDDLLNQCADQVTSIGVTGQMHGIVYLNKAGEPVSPLYTWQDDRGSQILEDGTYASVLSRLTGYPVASGYGLSTHFYHVRNGLVPESACCISTIHDYIAMKLSGLCSPVTDQSDAASLGVFDMINGRFDDAALLQAEIDPSILPNVASDPVIGTYRSIPVCVPIGDNQASFFGATGGRSSGALVNIGTGSQFSVYCNTPIHCPGLELRPYPGGGYLLVGATLCGGRAYALLERFFADVVKMVTGSDAVSCYDAMEKRLEEMGDVSDVPRVLTTFGGTRSNAGLRGAFLDVGIHNFTAGHWTAGVLKGICSELYQMYETYLSAGGQPIDTFYGSGNGLRKNPYLQKTIAEEFSLPLVLPPYREEAAVGAALYAARCVENKKTAEDTHEKRI